MPVTSESHVRKSSLTVRMRGKEVVGTVPATGPSRRNLERRMTKKLERKVKFDNFHRIVIIKMKFHIYRYRNEGAGGE